MTDLISDHGLPLISIGVEPLDLAAFEARRQYDRAIELAFIRAHHLLLEGKPDDAELVAKGAAALRWYASEEVR